MTRRQQRQGREAAQQVLQHHSGHRAPWTGCSYSQPQPKTALADRPRSEPQCSAAVGGHMAAALPEGGCPRQTAEHATSVALRLAHHAMPRCLDRSNSEGQHPTSRPRAAYEPPVGTHLAPHIRYWAAPTAGCWVELPSPHASGGRCLRCRAASVMQPHACTPKVRAAVLPRRLPRRTGAAAPPRRHRQPLRCAHPHPPPCPPPRNTPIFRHGRHTL